MIPLPPMLVPFMFLIGTRFLFLRAGLFKEIGPGRFGDKRAPQNYVSLVPDPLYCDALLLSFKLPALLVIATV